MNKRYLRGDGSNHVEDLKEHSLGDGGIKFTHVEGGVLALLVVVVSIGRGAVALLRSRAGGRGLRGSGIAGGSRGLLSRCLRSSLSSSSRLLLGSCRVGGSTAVGLRDLLLNVDYRRGSRHLDGFAKGKKRKMGRCGWDF